MHLPIVESQLNYFKTCVTLYKSRFHNGNSLIYAWFYFLKVQNFISISKSYEIKLQFQNIEFNEFCYIDML